jgi:predicted metalloprotease with PDZ domain
MNPVIHYTVTPLISRNIFAIRMSVQNTQDGFEVYLPNWIPGSYMLRDFARHIVTIRAEDDHHQPIKLTPLNQHAWHVSAQGNVTLHYEVYAHDTSVRTAFLDASGGFVNGTSLFLSVKHLDQHAHRVTLLAPTDHADWQIATTLSRMPNTIARGFGDYFAHDYDELVDHPVRIGQLTWLKFKAHDTPHEVAIAGHVPYLNKAVLMRDLQSICENQITLFNSPAPFKRYLFIVDARGDGYGGLEHRDSTALLCRRDDLPKHMDAVERREEYLTFLGLCSHEYFHSWNVKRMKPANFVTYDLAQTIDTSLLWFFEGVTSYYDDLVLVRTSILSEAQYFKRLENTFNAVMRHDGNRVQTVSESGFYAWTKYYQASPNTPNAVVSYYAKGSLVALALDLFIRQHSHSRFSFDDVMRDLWQAFGRDFYQNPRGLALDDIIRACQKYAPNIEPLFQTALHSTDDLPLHDLFKANGMSLTQTKSNVAQLGATIKKVDGGYQIMRVLNNGAAQKANLAPDDVLLTFDSLKLNTTPDDALKHFKTNQTITVHFLRDDVLCSTTLVTQVSAQGIYQLARATA